MPACGRLGASSYLEHPGAWRGEQCGTLPPAETAKERRCRGVRWPKTEGERAGRGAALGPRVHGKRPELTESDRQQNRTSKGMLRLFAQVEKAGSADS